MWAIFEVLCSRAGSLRANVSTAGLSGNLSSLVSSPCLAFGPRGDLFVSEVTSGDVSRPCRLHRLDSRCDRSIIANAHLLRCASAIVHLCFPVHFPSVCQWLLGSHLSVREAVSRHCLHQRWGRDCDEPQRALAVAALWGDRGSYPIVGHVCSRYNV